MEHGCSIEYSRQVNPLNLVAIRPTPGSQSTFGGYFRNPTLPLAAGCLVLLTALSAAAASVEQRVESLLAGLSLEEKIDMIGGEDSFYIRGNERLGIPRLVLSDGPVGVRNLGPSTAYPATILLAASWDVDLAGRVGTALGRDCRARGVHVLLAPGVNITRLPQCGRNFEYFGEDPYLTSRLAVGYIQGLQAQGVSGTVKHFAANNHESDRMHDSSEVDERTLNEIYFPAFRAAVQEAHVGAVMCAYNRLNGTYCSANKSLLTDTLKHGWGFQGFVMSDWNAAHETLGCVNAGLDLEMPSGQFMNREDILPLIKSGRVDEATIDDKVRRILRVAARMGWLDRPQKDEAIPLNDPQSAEVALEVARAGIVLLKNERSLLPLDVKKIKNLVIVGPNAEPAVIGGGGSSGTVPLQSTNTLAGIRTRAGQGVEVIHIPASREQDYAQLCAHSKFSGPLRAEYFANARLEGTPVMTREEQQINVNWGRNNPVPNAAGEAFSVRWKGEIRPEESGEYVFVLTSDDGARARLDGNVIVDVWGDHPALTGARKVALNGGQTHTLEVEYYNSAMDAMVQFGWGKLPPLLKPEDVEKIAAADVAVVCAGFNKDLEGEGSDRTFELPEGQDELISDIARANPRTVVILNSGGSVDMRSWIKRVPALLQAWYPGQAGGQAIAEVLVGDVNPSGKLPVTFERRWKDAAAYGSYPARDGIVAYDEGVLVGYRHFDAKRIKPQFCFGYGLSYTEFKLSNMEAEWEGDRLAVSVDVENCGARAGAEVVQLYVADKRASVVRPERELKAFRKVNLEPGEKQTVHFTLDRTAFAFYDVESHDWIVEPGVFEVAVGNASRRLPLRKQVDVAAGAFGSDK